MAIRLNVAVAELTTTVDVEEEEGATTVVVDEARRSTVEDAGLQTMATPVVEEVGMEVIVAGAVVEADPQIARTEAESALQCIAIAVHVLVLVDAIDLWIGVEGGTIYQFLGVYHLSGTVSSHKIAVHLVR